MKLLRVSIVIFLMKVLISNARSTLRVEINEASQFINLPKIQKITREYFENDLAVQNLLDYLQSEEFTSAWNVFMTSSEVEDILQWIKYHGVNTDKEIELLSHEIEKIKPINSQNESIQTFSIKSFSDELKSLINFKSLNATIDELLKDENDFAHLYLILTVSRRSLENLFQREEILRSIESLKRLGVDMEALKAELYEILRWE
ncbi:CLUMA_CG021317, isoform A [Clunio marinus]|uniref:CLUMA_CG021317, isoform A n=1 Tax=Clunio marinus TaxID=568069 RepID=A0A1J1J7D1_9DIPT|nr:CLUMA_CG021317, isoform A [Clunio marinus]